MNTPKTVEKCKSFSEILKLYASSSPDKIYIYDGNTGISYSFAEVDRLVDSAVSLLLNNGCRQGDVISVILNNRFDYIVLFFAALRSGVIFSPFPFSLSTQDLDKYLSYVEPRIVFCQDKHSDFLRERGWNVKVVDARKTESLFLEELRKVKPHVDQNYSPSHDYPACIYYSSGTTGNPKGVVFSHGNMIENISSIVRGFGWTSDDCHLMFLPLGHTASINYSFLPCTYCGAKIVLFESFWKTRNHLWDYVEKFDVTYMEVVPSVLFSMLNSEYEGYSRDKLKKFKYIGCGSAPLPVEVQNAVSKKFGIKVGNLYGLSETGPTHVDDPLKNGWVPGSIGYPLDVNKVKIFNDNGDEVESGSVGEIAIKGKNVFINYHKNENAYKDVFKNGYFLTGDLGYVDKEGRFYFCDRKKDLIIKGGVNIYPGEIDEVIFSNDKVKEVMTVGFPDSFLGERIKSFIVPKDGMVIDKKDLRQLCLDKLGEFKCPDEFIFVDDIPKGHSGKLLRRKLREESSNAQ